MLNGMLKYQRLAKFELNVEVCNSQFTSAFSIQFSIAMGDS